MRLTRILSELDDYSRKQLRRKKKFAMSEAGGQDFKIELDKDGFEELDALANRFGTDLEGLVEQSIQEKGTPDYISMSPEDMETGGIVLTIDKSVMENLEEFMELGMDAKDWYSDMNKKILNIYGESDGCLLLILLAIFSPRNRLSSNLRLAAQTYCGIKQDLEDKESKEKLEQLMELKPRDAYERIKGGEFLELKTVRGAKEGAVFFNVYIPNLLRVLRLYKRSGYQFNQRDVATEISKHLQPSHKLDKESIISAEKVFSFTLNLLDPDFEFEGSGWLPTTIDTWMAAFFWPHLSKDDQLKAVGKTQNYVYLAKKTQELAARYNMKPHQMQAVIWVAMIRKKQGPNYDVTFNSAIEKNFKRLKLKLDEIKDVDEFFDKVIDAIGCVF